MISEIKRNDSKFQCFHCGVLSQQTWFNSETFGQMVNQISEQLYYEYRSGLKSFQEGAVKRFLEEFKVFYESEVTSLIPAEFALAKCSNCGGLSLWMSEEPVYPKSSPVAPPNDDLADEVKDLYNEAASIVTESPKGAAALLRLALQMLLSQLGEQGSNINQDIKALVDRGLSPKIQQSLDILRVVGNHAVHPGEINLEDNRDLALKLFKVLNLIAEEMITTPNEVNKLYEDIIPEGTREAISKRDNR